MGAIISHFYASNLLNNNITSSRQVRDGKVEYRQITNNIILMAIIVRE